MRNLLKNSSEYSFNLFYPRHSQLQSTVSRLSASVRDLRRALEAQRERQAKKREEWGGEEAAARKKEEGLAKATAAVRGIREEEEER